MDCLKAFRPDYDMPWFDDYREVREAYRVHHDGSHYVAVKCIPMRPRKHALKNPRREKWHLDELFE